MITTEVRDVPIAYGGTGVLSPYDYRYTNHIYMLVKQTHKGTSSNILLFQCIHDLIIEYGLYGPLW